MTHSPIVALRRRISTRQVSLSRLMPVLLSALALVTAGPAAWASASTTTSLFTTPDNPSSGAVITMTAQVESTEFTVAGGTVTFVDTYNGQPEVLATVQVQSTNGNPGTAVLQTEVGGVGNHQFVATYNGTSVFATSSSSSQSVTFVAPYLTATALTSTGTSPNAKLTGTVSAFGPSAPTGNVTFTDTTSNFVLGTAPLNAGTLQTGFTSSQNYPIANMDNGQTGGTIGPAIGDFNGDGRPDFAVPTNGGPIVLLLGKGDGTFTTGTPLASAASFTPTSVVVGDFNGDGKQDIAVLSAQGIGSVNIFLGNGNGTFQAAKNFPVATSNSASRLMAMGDFNRDGIEDLVATNSSLNQVAVILGNGDGTFNAPTFYSVGSSPWNVVVGDLNNDGIQDLAVASDGSGSVTVLQGNGDGTFKSAIFVPTGASQVGSVALGDFNGDGFLDLATTSAPDNGVYVLLNKKTTGTPSFGTANKTAMNSGPYYLTIGDFDRNGKTDIISANNGNTTVGLLLGNGSGGFAAATYYTVGGGAIFATEGDINGDDQVDLTAVTENGLSVLLSGQSESATLSNVAFFGCGAQSVTATYDGDGNYGQSTSSALTFTPAKQNTTLTLTVTPANGVTGQQRALQATLSPYAYGSTTTNGEVVTFTDNGNPIGTAVLASGVAVLNIALPFNTNDRFRATYAGDCAFNNSNSNRVTGSTLNSSILTWPNPAPITFGTALSGTQLNATDNAPGGGTFTYTPPAGTILPAGTSTLSVTFNPVNATYGNETATVPITVGQAQTVITWPTPTPITYGTPLSSFQLDATASSGIVSVPLNTYYNVSGIYSPGSIYSTGGFDADGYSYSTTTLGSTLTWNGMTFNLGPPNAQDAVSNETILLPQGKFTNLYMLGAMVNNIGAGQTFIVTYTDNSTQTFNQNMSDWFNAAGWLGESVISCAEQRNFSDGHSASIQPDSVCVYGYQIPLNVNKTVKSVQLPNTRNIVMLSMDLTTPTIPGTFVYTPPAGTVEPVGTDTLSVVFTPTDTTDYKPASATVQLVVDNPPAPIVTPTISWPTPAPITYGTLLGPTQLDAVAMGTARATPVIPTSQLVVISTSTDGTPYNQPGLDNISGDPYNGDTYSYKLLGNGSVNYGGTTYTLGQPTVPNSITNGAVYTLPSPGKYANVYLIGTATTTGQTKQPFILTYSTGSPVTETLDMSSWAKSAGYADETIVAATAYANTQGGGQVPAPAGGAFNLYGYQLTADPTRTLVSVSVPNNRNVVIMALGFGSNTQVVVPGTYVYNPAAGSTPPLSVGTHTLNVTFTPDNTGGYNGATGSTTIQVIPATPIINWPTPAAISTTTPLTGIQLDATVTFQGSPLPGTLFYTIPPGTTDAHNQTLTAGVHTLKVVFTPTDTTDFNSVSATVQIVVGTIGSTGITGSPLFSSGDCCFFSQPTPYAITVTGSTVAPTGTVTVVFNSQTIGTATLVPGSGATSSASLFVPSIYFAPGNNTVTLNYLGDANYIPLSNTAVIPLRNPAISANPAVAPGGSSTIQIPYAYVVDGAMSFNFTPAGEPASDFTNIASPALPACQSGVPEIAGTVCTLSVAFKPALPGIRKGVAEVDFTPASGPAEPKLYLFFSGLGSAAQASLSSATQAVLNSSLNQPQSLTFDPTDLTNSTLYVSNSMAGQIDTLAASGGALTQWNAANTGNLVYPTELVFDAFGNLVVVDANVAKVFSFSPPPALTESTVGTGTFTLGVPTTARVDFAGNLYVADGGNTPRIIEIPGEPFDTTYVPTQLNLGSFSVSFPQALAVDNTGNNLYIGDGDLNDILQVGLNGTGGTSQVSISPCATGVTCSLNGPAGFAFDPNGDMFITDGNARVLMVPINHSAANPTSQVPITGLVNPSGVTLDGSGNIFVTDLTGTVTKLMVNAGAMKITALNTSQTTTVTNTGNLNLKITALTFANGASSAYTQTNTCSGAIVPGGNCTITVTYSNAGGSGTDTLNLTTNAFTASGVAIQLSH
jgi:FG-GAP-like repeat/Bacterial Ig-like domain (group 3)